MRHALAIGLSFALVSCVDEAPAPNNLTSFKVEVLGVFERNGNARPALGVVSSCLATYAPDPVPENVKGTRACRYIIPRGEVEFDIKATAIGLDGQPVTDFSNTVSFRVVPGDLPSDLRSRWTGASAGLVETTVKALHPYGEVRVWVEDAPPKYVFDGGMAPSDQLPPEVVKRTFAAGASPVIYFADQTLQSLQQPSELDNRSSPFVGEFVVVGKDPTAGEVLKQTCADDPSRNGRDALMVVTGLDPSGFFVTDISACRLREQLSDRLGNSVRTPEPVEQCLLDAADGGREDNLDGGMGVCPISGKSCRKRSDCFGYLPGTYASMFIYNYNFPDGLDEGDLLFTLSGSVQEFTSTTQMVFPAWTTAERVRRLPQDQWNKWLQYAKPYDINMRTCGQDNAAVPFLTDALCGHNRRNMKMESLESGLVRLRRIRFPQKFVNCDFNANGSVPFFCETKPANADWQWSTCSFDAPEPEVDRVERECNQNCVIGLGDQAGVICSEESTFKGFGQYVVEMTLPGPARLGLDDQLSLRTQIAVAKLAVQPEPDGGVDAGVVSNPSVAVAGYGAGQEVAITCDRPARYRTGPDGVTALGATTQLAADQVIRYTFTGTETSVAFQAIDAQATCSVGINARTRINLITKDAVPELNPDCDENDEDAERAQQCKNLKGSEFDVIGHLRHVQPARPRWVVVPRAADDLCCYPGPGLECPKPIQRCQ
jgi:hypothetical protein